MPLPRYAGGDAFPAATWNQAADAIDEHVTVLTPGADATALVSNGTDLISRRLAAWDATWSGAIPYEMAGPGANSLHEGGTPHASMIDSSAAIQAANDQAELLGLPLVGRGRYRVDGTVNITVDADFTDAEFISNDNNINAVVLIGTRTSGASLRRLRVVAPKVHNAAKNPQNSGGWVGTSVGIEIANLTRSEVWIPFVSRYTTGVAVRGIGTGCADNTIHIDYADNSKVSLHGWSEAGGWVNANRFTGGKLGLQGGEGTLVAGVRQILLGHASFPDEGAPNGNIFEFNLEGDVAEYTVESIGGVRNVWIWNRWESTSNARFFWNEATVTRFSQENVIIGGYSANFIVHTVSANSTKNEVWAVGGQIIDGGNSVGLIRARNTFSSGVGIWQGYDTLTNPMTAGSNDWTFSLSAGHYRAKNKVHAQPVVKINHLNTVGIEFSDGTNPLDTDIKRMAANVLGTNDSFQAGIHLLTAGSAPAIAGGTGAGTGPTITLTGNDMAGRINLTTGTTPAGTNATLATITYATTFGATPPKRVALIPTNAAARNLAVDQEPFWDRAASSATQAVIKTGNTALAASTAYEWSYEVIG